MTTTKIGLAVERLIGRLVNQFKIIDKLGAGGMGEVYLAEDTKLRRQVALKFLPESYSADEELKSRLQHEAQAAAALNHPNIVTIYEFGEHEGRLFIAMEYVSGQTLAEVIAGGKLTTKKALEAAAQICDGLAVAHKAGIVHRDIKPANILIDGAGRAKILDFGLAKSRRATTETKVGTTLGTLSYESPEQSRGEEVDQRSDIFSFGVVLYEMITGKLPFAAEFEEAVRYAISHEEPQPLARFSSDVPARVQDIIDKALAKEPDERYQHADDALVDLKRALKAGAPSGITSHPPGSLETKPAVANRSRLIVPLAIVFVVALVALIFKPWKIEFSPTQEALAESNSLAVMYFENVVDPSDENKTARMLTSLLITNLSGTGKLKVVSRQRLFDILRLLGKEDEAALDQSVASEVAERANVRWILTGEVLQDDPLVVTAVISDAKTGDILTSERVTARSGESIFDVVDKLSAGILAKYSAPDMSDAPEPIDFNIAATTTSSAEAYRNFLEGMDLILKFYNNEAREKFLKAIELDSTFAMAYFWLANTSQGLDDAFWAMKQAVKFIDHAGEKDSLWIRVGEAQLASRTNDIRRLTKEIVKKYPDDKMGYLLLATNTGAGEKRMEYLLRAIELDPLFKEVYNFLAYGYDAEGKFERSIWAINKYIDLAPDEANPYDTRGDLYAFNGDIESAKRSYQKALEIKEDFFTSRIKVGGMQSFGGEYDSAEATLRRAIEDILDKSQKASVSAFLASPYSYQGQMKRALEILEQVIAAAELNNVDKSAILGIKLSRLRLFETLGDYDAALIVMSEGIRDFNKLKSVRLRDTLSIFAAYSRTLARAGKISEAELYADTLDALVDTTKDTTRSQILHVTRGEIAFAMQDYTEAVKQGELALGFTPNNFVRRYQLGRAYLANGQLAEAVEMFTKALSRYDSNRMQRAGANVKAYYYLGIAYEKSGWTDKAIEQYVTFLNIWKNADPEIKEIDDAKARLAQLRS
ncbi:MAG: protein kinase [candidate division Zixibacteria bacterium]|nr:protein kinase [candidate division Zixibacteria bacterium]